MNNPTSQHKVYRRVIRIDEVLEKTGLSKTQLYRLIKQSQFPAPARLSERVVVFDESEVDSWLNEKFQSLNTAPVLDRRAQR